MLKLVDFFSAFAVVMAAGLIIGVHSSRFVGWIVFAAIFGIAFMLTKYWRRKKHLQKMWHDEEYAKRYKKISRHHTENK